MCQTQKKLKMIECRVNFEFENQALSILLFSILGEARRGTPLRIRVAIATRPHGDGFFEVAAKKNYQSATGVIF